MSLARASRRSGIVRIRASWLATIVFGIVLLVGGLRAQSIMDWYRLRKYQPPAVVASLADQTTMTPAARHLFYLNRPGIDDKASFRSQCPDYGEKTIVLGCYKSGQRGIYVLKVTDSRLEGVEQVTAAHEMLHAAYDRLSRSEKQTIDQQLQDYADHQLTDQRIKNVLKGYETSEPGQELNEMHSIFGSEIAQLPASLETYYARYFSNRRIVAQYAAHYQAAFSDRQAQITAYDSQLKQEYAAIQANLKQLDQQQAAIASERQRLDGLRSQGAIAAYNDGVAGYNARIDDYNNLLASTKSALTAYNQKVDERNAVAAETATLTQAIDSSVLPKQQ